MPALPSNTSFRNTMQAMTVTGVQRHFDYPPGSIQPGDLPAAFCMPPGADLGEYVMTCVNENRTRTMTFVICLEAVALDNAEQNYDLIAPAMDNLESALDTALTSVANWYEYSMETGTIPVGGTDYWAITAEVTIRSV